MNRSRSTRPGASQRDAIVAATRAALAAQVSAPGMARLVQLAQSGKRHMNVVSYPKMP